MRLTASPGEDLQDLVDGLAANGGGTIALEPGATFDNVSLALPWRPDLRYQNIRLIGNRTRLIGREGAPLLHIGAGCPDYALPKLAGIELHGIDFDVQGDGVTLQQTDGAIVDDCTFANSAREALVTGGADSTTNTVVRNCHARNCGKGWPAGPLAAFNMNCWNGRLEYSTANDCGLFGEFGGNGTRITHCHAVDSPLRIGSGSFGCSNIEISQSRFERSYIECANPIGIMSDIRIIGNQLRDSPLCWSGSALKNNVNIAKLSPDFTDPSMFNGNTILAAKDGWEGHGIRLTAWHKELPPGPLYVSNNYFVVRTGEAVVSQGQPGECVFISNAWPDAWYTIYRTLPDQTPLPDPLPHWTIKGKDR